MRGIRDISVEELNNSVELVAELDQTIDFDNIVFKRRTWSVGGANQDWHRSLQGIVSGILDCIDFGTHDKQNGKVVFKWVDKDIAVKALTRIVSDLISYIDVIRQPILLHRAELEELNGEELSDRDVAQRLINKLYNTAKVNKNNTATVANTIRAICEFYRTDNTDELIKEFSTEANNQRKFYIYKTNKNIAPHYKALSERNHLTTCMTKGLNDGLHKHFTPCDEALAKQAGYYVENKTSHKTPHVFTANVDGFEGLDDVALFLTSYHSPDELKTADKYAFIGRAIGWCRGGQWVYTRYYGQESTELTFAKVVERVSSFKDMRVKAYHCLENIRRNGVLIRRCYIVPYIDGNDNFLRINSEVMTDEIGRPYQWATVVEGHRSNISKDAENLEYPYDVYVLSQSDWFTQPVPFNTTCAITGVDIATNTTVLVNGHPVHYQVSDFDKLLANVKAVMTTPYTGESSKVEEDKTANPYFQSRVIEPILDDPFLRRPLTPDTAALIETIPDLA